MKKFILALLIIGIFILYSFMYGHTTLLATQIGNSSSASSSTASATVGVVSTSTSGDSATPNATSSSSGSTNPVTSYKDGSYTGSVADAHWGNIQVKAVIQNGKITDVVFLQYPSDLGHSIEINQFADPRLTAEAISAQSANVDIITGATDTSDAFIQSLSDALSQ